MARRYSREDIEIAQGWNYRMHTGCPMVNVKMYRGPGTSPPSTSATAKHFKCSEKLAEQALEFAIRNATEQFWDWAQDYATEVLGKYAKVYSAGRSGGYLVIDGIGRPVEDRWDAIRIGQWRKFETGVREVIRNLLSEAEIFDQIEANRWADEGAEEHNFTELPNGEMACIADIKRQVIETVPGGADVIRR